MENVDRHEDKERRAFRLSLTYESTPSKLIKTACGIDERNIAPFLEYEGIFGGSSQITSALSHREAATNRWFAKERSLVA